MTPNQQAVLRLLSWSEAMGPERHPYCDFRHRLDGDGPEYTYAVHVYTGELDDGTYASGWEFGETLSEAVDKAIASHAVKLAEISNPGRPCGAESDVCKPAVAQPMGKVTVEGEIAW